MSIPPFLDRGLIRPRRTLAQHLAGKSPLSPRTPTPWERADRTATRKATIVWWLSLFVLSATLVTSLLVSFYLVFYFLQLGHWQKVFSLALCAFVWRKWRSMLEWLLGRFDRIRASCVAWATRRPSLGYLLWKCWDRSTELGRAIMVAVIAWWKGDNTGHSKNGCRAGGCTECADQATGSWERMSCDRVSPGALTSLGIPFLPFLDDQHILVLWKLSGKALKEAEALTQYLRKEEEEEDPASPAATDKHSQYSDDSSKSSDTGSTGGRHSDDGTILSSLDSPPMSPVPGPRGVPVLRPPPREKGVKAHNNHVRFGDDVRPWPVHAPSPTRSPPPAPEREFSIGSTQDTTPAAQSASNNTWTVPDSPSDVSSHSTPTESLPSPLTGPTEVPQPPLALSLKNVVSNTATLRADCIALWTAYHNLLGAEKPIDIQARCQRLHQHIIAIRATLERIFRIDPGPSIHNYKETLATIEPHLDDVLGLIQLLRQDLDPQNPSYPALHRIRALVRGVLRGIAVMQDKPAPESDDSVSDDCKVELRRLIPLFAKEDEETDRLAEEKRMQETEKAAQEQAAQEQAAREKAVEEQAKKQKEKDELDAIDTAKEVVVPVETTVKRPPLPRWFVEQFSPFNPTFAEALGKTCSAGQTAKGGGVSATLPAIVRLKGPKDHIELLQTAISQGFLPTSTSSAQYLCGLRALTMSLEAMGRIEPGSITPEVILGRMFVNPPAIDVEASPAGQQGVPTEEYAEFLRQKFSHLHADMAEDERREASMINNFESMQLLYMLELIGLWGLRKGDDSLKLGIVTAAHHVEAVKGKDGKITHKARDEPATVHILEDDRKPSPLSQSNVVWVYNDKWWHNVANYPPPEAPDNSNGKSVAHWSGFATNTSDRARWSDTVKSWGLSIPQEDQNSGHPGREQENDDNNEASPASEVEKDKEPPEKSKDDTVVTQSELPAAQPGAEIRGPHVDVLRRWVSQGYLPTLNSTESSGSGIPALITSLESMGRLKRGTVTPRDVLSKMFHDPEVDERFAGARGIPTQEYHEIIEEMVADFGAYQARAREELSTKDSFNVLHMNNILRLMFRWKICEGEDTLTLGVVHEGLKIPASVHVLDKDPTVDGLSVKDINTVADGHVVWVYNNTTLNNTGHWLGFERNANDREHWIPTLQRWGFDVPNEIQSESQDLPQALQENNAQQEQSQPRGDAKDGSTETATRDLLLQLSKDLDTQQQMSYASREEMATTSIYLQRDVLEKALAITIQGTGDEATKNKQYLDKLINIARNRIGELNDRSKMPDAQQPDAAGLTQDIPRNGNGQRQNTSNGNGTDRPGKNKGDNQNAHQSPKGGSFAAVQARLQALSSQLHDHRTTAERLRLEPVDAEIDDVITTLKDEFLVQLRNIKLTGGKNEQGTNIGFKYDLDREAENMVEKLRDLKTKNHPRSRGGGSNNRGGGSNRGGGNNRGGGSNRGGGNR